MTDRYYGIPSGMNGPMVDADAITPNDHKNLEGGVTRGLYVGSTGNLAVMFHNGKICLFKGVPVGILPVRVLRVMATDTTADDIVGLY